MKRLFQYAVLFILFGPAVVSAQENSAGSIPAGKGLFDSDDVLELTLTGNITDVLNDRQKESTYRPLLLQHKDSTTDISMPVAVKTRGHFRKLKENCFYPPLMVQFKKSDSLKASIFNGHDKLKLVMPCDEDSYVVKEWLVYKMYNLVTPKSFRARLVRVTLNDTKRKKLSSPFYGIMLEPEKLMAKRNNNVIVTRKVQPEHTDYEAFLKMAVFEYLVGNTDWCIQYLQNIRLLAKDSTGGVLAVPYDFDHSGVVNAPYAHPAEELLMASVRQRRYRGFCVRNIRDFEPVIAFYNGLKDDIYRLYTDCKLLDQKTIKSTLGYLDDFYKAINDPKQWQKDFSYPCNKNGTGHIVIKGLKDE